MPTNNQPSYRVPSVCLPVSDDECKASRRNRRREIELAASASSSRTMTEDDFLALTCLPISNRRKKMSSKVPFMDQHRFRFDFSVY